MPAQLELAWSKGTLFSSDYPYQVSLLNPSAFPESLSRELFFSLSVFYARVYGYFKDSLGVELRGLGFLLRRLDSPCILRLDNSLFYFNPAHSQAYRRIIAGHHNEPETISFLRFLASQTSLSLIDVGGCLGEIAIPVSKEETIAKVWIFEPLPELCSIIAVNIALNNLSSKVSLFPLAVSSSNGKVDILMPSVATGSGVISQNPASPPTTIPGSIITIESITLDSFFDVSMIDGNLVVLIDVEGHELSVLKGGAAGLSPCASLLLFLNIIMSPSRAFRSMK